MAIKQFITLLMKSHNKKKNKQLTRSIWGVLGVYKEHREEKLTMYRETLNNFMLYFWVVTDWGIIWLIFVLTYFMLKGLSK